jgi:hypothetical protein
MWLIWRTKNCDRKYKKKLENFKLCKKELKSILLSHSFYSIDGGFTVVSKAGL